MLDIADGIVFEQHICMARDFDLASNEWQTCHDNASATDNINNDNQTCNVPKPCHPGPADTCVKTSPYAGDDPIAFHFEAAVTLNSPATPGSKRGSAHSSPALNRHEHSEQHPAKAFIVSNGEEGMGQPGEQQQQLFGGPERASVSPESGRRAVWLGSQQQGEAGRPAG